MLKENKFQQAQHTFTDSNWKAVAAYRASDYQAALDLRVNSPKDYKMLQLKIDDSLRQLNKLQN